MQYKETHLNRCLLVCASIHKLLLLHYTTTLIITLKSVCKNYRKQHLVVKVKQVDGYGVFPCIVLHGPCQKGLGEEEARQPEYMGLL